MFASASLETSPTVPSQHSLLGMHPTLPLCFCRAGSASGDGDGDGDGGAPDEPARGREIPRAFSGVWSGGAPLEQYVASVTAVSSFWGGSMDYHPFEVRPPRPRPTCTRA